MKENSIRFDIILLIISILLVIAYGAKLKVSVLWAGFVFIVPLIVIVSYVNLIIGSIVVLFGQGQYEIFFQVKLILFFIANFMLYSAREFPFGLPIGGYVFCVFLLFFISFLLSVKIKAVVVILLGAVYVFTNDLLIYIISDASIKDEYIRWAIACAMLVMSVPRKSKRSGAKGQ